MSTPTEQILIGGVTAALCLSGFYHETQILKESRYGRFLVRQFGPEKASLFLKGLLVIGILFGVLLAMNIIRPVRW